MPSQRVRIGPKSERWAGSVNCCPKRYLFIGGNPIADAQRATEAPDGIAALRVTPEGRLEKSDENRLTDSMCTHLYVALVAHPDRFTLDEAERAVLLDLARR